MTATRLPRTNSFPLMFAAGLTALVLMNTGCNSEDNTGRLITQNHTWVLEETGRVRSGSEPMIDLSFVPGSNTLVSLGWKSQSGTFWDGVTGLRRATASLDDSTLRAMAASPDGRWVAFGGDWVALAIWDAQTRREASRIPCSSPLGAVESLTFSSDGESLALSRSSGDVEVVLVSSGRRLILAEKTWPCPPRTLFADKANALLVYGMPKGDPEIVDLDTGRVRGTLRGHRGGVSSACLLKGGDQVVTAGEDGSLRYWRLPSMRMEQIKRGLPATVLSLSLRAAGDLLAAGDSEGNLLVLNLLSGNEVARARVDGFKAWSVAWDEAGSGLVSGTDNGLIQFWSVAASGRKY